MAPDFDLPAADGEGTVALAAYRRRGPVLLAMLRGLYCPFCRRYISQLKPTCGELRAVGIEPVGVIVASPERARRYFAHFPPPFPMAAAPDRSIHRAYGLEEVTRTAAMREAVEQRASEILGEAGIAAPPGQAGMIFGGADGFEMTTEDEAERQRPLQTCAYFLVGRDGVIRWARALEPPVTEFPLADELHPLV
jgi:peroxiredoxin